MRRSSQLRDKEPRRWFATLDMADWILHYGVNLTRVIGVSILAKPRLLKPDLLPVRIAVNEYLSDTHLADC